MRDVAQAGRVVSFILFDVANSARGDIVSMVTATLRFTRVSVRRRRNEVKRRNDSIDKQTNTLQNAAGHVCALFLVAPAVNFVVVNFYRLMGRARAGFIFQAQHAIKTERKVADERRRRA